MIKEAIQLLAQGNNLSKQQAYECMNEIMAGEASQIQMASYLTVPIDIQSLFHFWGNTRFQ